MIQYSILHIILFLIRKRYIFDPLVGKLFSETGREAELHNLLVL